MEITRPIRDPGHDVETVALRGLAVLLAPVVFATMFTVALVSIPAYTTSSLAPTAMALTWSASNSSPALRQDAPRSAHQSPPRRSTYTANHPVPLRAQPKTRPWTASFPLRGTDDRMYEYACHEGNERSLEGIFRAARISRGGR